MGTVAEELSDLTTEVSEAAGNLRESLTVSAVVVKNQFETQKSFLTHLSTLVNTILNI
jgi:hypothetical protein